MAHVLGQVGPYCEGKEDWACYVERLEQFFIANDITDAPKKRAVLLSGIGPLTYSVLRNLMTPDVPSSKSYDELKSTLSAHFKPKTLVIAERFRFYKRNQHENESISDYIVELKKLASTCDFGDFLSSALRDRLVCGLRSESIQRKLLTEVDLTFDKAERITVAMELAQRNAVDLQPPSSSGGIGVNKVEHRHNKKSKASASASKPAKECWRCGGDKHNANDCKFKSLKCFNCSKQGHSAKKCRSEKKKTVPVAKTSFLGISSSNVGYSDEDLHTIFTCRGDVKATLQETVSVNGVPLTMEIDTGAVVSVVGNAFYEKYLPHVPLSSFSKQLHSYSGEVLATKGEILVDVDFKGQKAKLPLVVVDGDKPALLGRNWLMEIKLDWNQLFVVNYGLGEELLNKYKYVFDAQHGVIKGFKADLLLKKDAKPVFKKARPVPFSLREIVEKELDRLTKDGIMTPVMHSEWASPIVVVQKTDGRVRICGDYKVSVNPVLDVDQYPLPNIEDIFATLSGGVYFSKLDLSNAYQQLELEEDAKNVLTINTHKGLFRIERLNFGVSSAPAIFQSVMDRVLSGVKNVVCYLDDILITTRSIEEHKEIISEVLQRLEKHNIKAKLSKCEFFKSSVNYLGYKIDKEGLHPTEEKIRAIIDAPAPTNVTELRSWLGLINYYGRFQRSLASILGPLHVLLRKSVTWEWSDACQKAFEACKAQLSSSKVLVHYDTAKPLKLDCDASSYGVGAVLSHMMEDGSERPIAYASRTLTSSERNYAQLEKEALAMIFGVKKFHKYLCGRTFTLVTDHKPLTSILGAQSGIPTLAAARLQRWALILAAYQYKLLYRKSSDHANADALSRLPSGDSQEGEESSVCQVRFTDSLPISAKDIQQETGRDPLLSRVLSFVLNGWPEACGTEELRPYFNHKLELSAEQGCVLWGTRVVIPPKYRNRMLEELHETHQGICRTKAYARSYIWWPNLDSQIEEFLKTCESCQMFRNKPAHAPLHPWKFPARAWQRIHIDYGMFDKKMLLIVIDSYSKWIEVHEMSSTTSGATIDKLRCIFASYGLPEELVSDNGPQFASEDFDMFLKRNGIKHTLIPPYHPASNGAAERAVQTVKQALSKMWLDHKRNDTSVTWSRRLADFLLTYRSTPHSVTRQAPSELLMKRILRTRLSLVKPNLASAVEEKQHQQIKYHDKKGVKSRELRENQSVLVRNHRDGMERWIPGVIVKKKGPLTYLVKCGQRIRFVHIEHLLSSAIPPKETTEELPVIPDVLPPIELEKTGDEKVVEDSDLPSKETPEKEELQIESEVQKSPEVRVAKTPDVSLPAKTPERRYPTRIRRPPKIF